jgi:hypothetical protein
MSIPKIKINPLGGELTPSEQSSCDDPTSTRYGFSSLSDYITEKRRTSPMDNLQERICILSILKENRCFFEK